MKAIDDDDVQTLSRVEIRTAMTLIVVAGLVGLAVTWVLSHG